MRRSSDVARLAVGEVEARLDGSTHYVVPRHKTEAARGLLARSLPPPRPEDARPDGEPDLPHCLLQRLLGDLAHLPVSARLFTTCRAQVAAKLFAAWLLEELRLMGIVAPVGTFYASHSLKSGGATAANAAGVPRGAIAELSATTERTLAASYISALAPPTDYDRFFFLRGVLPLFFFCPFFLFLLPPEFLTFLRLSPGLAAWCVGKLAKRRDGGRACLVAVR